MNFTEIIAVIVVTLISLWIVKVLHLRLHLHKIRRANQPNSQQNNTLARHIHFETNAATNPHQLLHRVQQIPQ